MILAGQAAVPVLVASVLYASVKLLPAVHFPPQCDVAVFIAQFVALDVGGLSLNKLANQAKKDGNEVGAIHARRLSIALVSVMLIGVIMAGVDQVVKLDGQVGTVIDTLFLIARAVMAVLYSRVIHSLKKDDEPEPLSEEYIEEYISRAVKAAFTTALAAMQEEIDSQIEATLSQHFEERLTGLNVILADGLARLEQEQAVVISETIQARSFFFGCLFCCMISFSRNKCHKRSNIPNATHIATLFLWQSMSKEPVEVGKRVKPFRMEHSS